MVLGALVHLGVPKDYLEENIQRLPLEAFHLEVSTAERMHIHGRQVAVVVEKEDHVSRDYRDIRGLIEQSALSEKVKKQSLSAFKRLAQVEAQIHNRSEDDVHFHELGGIDSIVDIVGTALGMEWLQVGRGLASEIPLGKGFVSCAHGRLPVPAPATVALLEGVSVYGTSVPYELVTPTGAAIVTTFADSFGPLPRMRVQQVGYGAGTRNLEEMPNMLRIMVGETQPVLEQDGVSVIETNIDDMNPEIFGFVMERLFEDGALDVIWIPVFMKKNRPGTMIQVICNDRDKDQVVHRLLSETTAIGVRHYRTDRMKLPRKLRTVSTTLGKVQVKEVAGPSDRVSVVPEYEACKRIALEKQLPLKVVYETIVREISG
jgi:uncharacterized protein (TIGR00299 family) protein